MATNVTRYMMDASEVVLERDPAEVARARDRARHTWPAIVGFTAGGALGAACFVANGQWALALPAGLALCAMAVGLYGTQTK